MSSPLYHIPTTSSQGRKWVVGFGHYYVVVDSLIHNFQETILTQRTSVATPLLEECEDDTHTPEMGTWEPSRTPKNLELDCRGQNTLHWGVLYNIRKL